jgi:hypothetical protein
MQGVYIHYEEVRAKTCLTEQVITYWRLNAESGFEHHRYIYTLSFFPHECVHYLWNV